jgi:hypothetical protein
MLLSGGLSTMNVWANSVNDIYFSLNDVYMIFLMTGWMFLFMGLYYSDRNVLLFGILLTASSLFAIRTQFMISESQFLRGMIPHHSMAVLMSKKLEKKENTIQDFLDGIITTQQREIEFMKARL